MSIIPRVTFVVLLLLLGVNGAMSKDRSKLRIGTTGIYPPFSYVENDKLQGFDVDIAQALCRELKTECEFVLQDWDSLIPSLLAHRFDVIMSSMSITEERKQQISFTDKYYSTPMAFVGRKDSNLKPQNPETAKGLVIGVQDSTTHADVIRQVYSTAGATARLYATQDEALLDLSHGRLDAVLADKLGLLEWLGSTQDSACCALVGDDIRDPLHLGSGIGAALRKEDDEWRDQLNAAIKAIRADGTYQKINDRYFPFDIY